ncbi:hypothetical protein [Cryobacterium sp. GrIS_2_6]|uniref:hypothetical protein n=1 Tax=Cryobacterium sp. GrIS_2_6 TaxID=3162785 RepID=UPI002E0B4984|nr:GNAT superfamily N-acetyltransferase [Cryobacterium psychrotolerans]
MSPVVTITLTLLVSLTANQVAAASQVLGVPDVEVAGADDGAELVAVNLRRAPRTSWLVRVDNKAAGIFALAPTPRDGYDVQASVYLRSEWRGVGLFGELYEAAGAAACAAGVKACSSVAEVNLRSIAAHRRVFVADGRLMVGVKRVEEMFWLFDFAGGVMGVPGAQ